MAASFSQFISTIKQKGIAKQYYYCEIYPPRFLTYDSETAQAIPFYVAATNMPEIGLMTQSVKDAGLTREVVVDKTYGTVTMTFLSDQDMKIKSFFDLWVSSVVLNKGGKFMYPEDYTSELLQITQMNSKKESSYIATLNRVYPKAVSDVSLSADTGAPLAFSVSWVFESWAATNVASLVNNEPLLTTPENTNMFNKAVAAINVLRKADALRTTIRSYQ